MALRIIKQLRETKVEIFFDSRFVVNQYQGNFQVNDLNLAKYKVRVKHLFVNFKLQKKAISITQVPRGENTEVDSLAKLVALGEQHLTQGFLFDEIDCPTVEQEESFPIEVRDTWMTLIFYYLTMETIPQVKLEAKSLVLKASNYGIIDGWMFRRAYLQPQLKCISQEEGI